MTTKAVKISDENYAVLVRKAAALSRERGKPVSLDKALKECLRPRKKKARLRKLALFKDDEEFIKAIEESYERRDEVKERNGGL